MTATNQQNSKQQNNTISDYDRALSALHAISPDIQRGDEWMPVMLAAIDEGIAKEAIQAWSATSDKYDPVDFERTWKDITRRPSGKVTGSTLYWHAMQHGWSAPRKQAGYTPPSPEESEHKQQERAVQKAITNAARIEQERIEGERAAAWANALNRASQPASPAHPYLQRKGIAPTATLRQIDASEAAAILGYAPSAGGKQLAGTLLLAVGKRTTGGLCTAELIDADGRKTAIKGAGTRTGAYWATGKPEAAAAILIAEGIATAISARDGSVLGLGDDVVGVATFSNGNLPDVAAAMRQQYPQAKIVLCADVDKATGTVPDKYAVEAAQLVGGYLAVPDFGADRPEGAKDFNDLHQLQGLEAVKACIDAAKLIEPEPAQAEAEADEGEAWDAPVALPDDLPPVEAFNLELLPYELRDWAADIADHIQQPVDFVAAAAVVGLSGLIGTRAAVHPLYPSPWKVFPNLWGMAIGESGTGKSPALDEALAPIEALDRKERQRHSEALQEWEIDSQLAELAAQAAKKAAAGDMKNGDAASVAEARRKLAEGANIVNTTKPAMRRFVVNDTTVEKLQIIMQENPFGVFMFRDELYGLLSAMEKQGQEGSRAFYLEAHSSNKSFSADRMGREAVYVACARLAMFGGIQPGLLQQLVRGATYGGEMADGLLQRFSISVWPDTVRTFRLVKRLPNMTARNAAYAVFNRLAELPTARGEGLEYEEAPALWRFDDAAQTIFDEWYEALQLSIRQGQVPQAMRSHYSKYGGLVPALALIFALVDTPDSGQVIGAVEMARAIGWAQYLRSHAERIYSAASTPDTSAAKALLQRIQAGKVPDGCTPRLIVQKGWEWLKTTEDVKKALTMLEIYNWVRLDAGKATTRGGRPSETIRINPALLTGKSYEEMQKGAA